MIDLIEFYFFFIGNALGEDVKVKIPAFLDCLCLNYISHEKVLCRCY